MAQSPDCQVNELKIVDGETIGSKNEDIEVYPLAFTVQFEDSNNKKLHINDKLSKFALKHRRNPSLPDFGVVTKTFPEQKPEPSVVKSSTKHLLSKSVRGGYYSEGYFSSDQEDEASRNRKNKHEKLSCSNSLSSQNTNFTQERKRITDQLNLSKLNKTSETIKLQNKMEPKDVKQILPNKNGDREGDNKSDTVSEAGTYTLDKDETKEILNETQDIEDGDNEDEVESLENEEVEETHLPSSYQLNHKWINDWVCQVAKQNFGSYEIDKNESPAQSKIPSPVGTLPKIKKTMNSKYNHLDAAGNKATISQHRRSSSLSAKELHDYRTSDTGTTTSSSLETQSYLRATESVVSAMQTRMNNKDTEPKQSGVVHQSLRLQFHTHHTSDTDTNSENEIKKKQNVNPITSTRLNRAFSLRRARAEPESEINDNKKKTNHVKDANVSKLPHQNSNSSSNSKLPHQNSNSSSNSKNSNNKTTQVKNKPPITSPFSRTDCGRFSTRSVTNTSKVANLTQKKDVGKKPGASASGNSSGAGGGGRSNSSLSSREVEFQNWKRRKSFDPMKAAAEGRKKEMAKRVAAMTQSVNVGSAANPRSNPVLRSASFHSTPQQVFSNDDADVEIEEEESPSPEEIQYSPGSSWVSSHPILPPNSPTKSYLRAALMPRTTISNSRNSLTSLISTTHSSPSRRAKLEALDSLVTTAISDLSHKLKGKSYTLLKKLSYAYDTDDDRSDRLRDEIAVLESQQQASASGSPSRQTSRDLSTILKNLKSLENVLKVLDDVLFDENIELIIDS